MKASRPRWLATTTAISPLRRLAGCRFWAIPTMSFSLTPAAKAAIDFGVYGAPKPLLIDKKGVIRYKVIGPMTEEVWKKDVKPIVDMLEKQ